MWNKIQMDPLIEGRLGGQTKAGQFSTLQYSDILESLRHNHM